MIVEFPLNEPQTLTWGHSEAYSFFDRFNHPRVRFNLQDGRVLFVDVPTANKIRALELKPGETFVVCKRRDGRRNVWVAWLTSETEKARAAQEKPLVEAELSGRLFIDRAPGKPTQPKRAPVVPMPVKRPELPGTGTYGPAPRPAAVTRVPEKIPMNVAFVEAVRFVNRELAANGEKWNDEARQAAVSTILIAASKAGWVTVWERPAA